MGAWGAGPFENDDAMDWVWALEEDTDGSALRLVLVPVAEYRPTGEPPEVEASRALAAAAVVARASCLSGNALPDEVEAWIATHAYLVDEELVALARGAVSRVHDAIKGEPGSAEWALEVSRLADDLSK